MHFSSNLIILLQENMVMGQMSLRGRLISDVLSTASKILLKEEISRNRTVEFTRCYPPLPRHVVERGVAQEGFIPLTLGEISSPLLQRER